MKTVFTTGEAAKICKVSQQNIIRCFDSGQLKGFRVPGSRFRRIPRDQLYAWGWRVPFLAGVLIAPVAFYIRRQLPETIAESQTHRSTAAVLGELWHGHSRAVVLGIFIICGGTVATYVLNYMTTYAITTLHLSATVGTATSCSRFAYCRKASKRARYAPKRSASRASVIPNAAPSYWWVPCLSRGFSARHASMRCSVVSLSSRPNHS